MRSGPCAGCTAQEITPSASPWRGRRCRPRAIRSQRGRHGGAESTHAGKNEGAGAGRRGGDQELQTRIQAFYRAASLGPPVLPLSKSQKSPLRAPSSVRRPHTATQAVPAVQFSGRIWRISDPCGCCKLAAARAIPDRQECGQLCLLLCLPLLTLPAAATPAALAATVVAACAAVVAAVAEVAAAAQRRARSLQRATLQWCRHACRYRASSSSSRRHGGTRSP